MKKRFSVFFIFFAFIFTIGCFIKLPSATAFAFNLDTAENGTEGNAEEVEFETKSKSVYFIDAFSGTVIYSKNENERLPIASMCKIMTLLICFEKIESNEIAFDEEVVVSENASGMGGSQVFLEANAKYKVEELIKAITIASANDACVAMAETICGSEREFTALMNKRAEELNMCNTVFANCTGLPCATQYSSALDVSVMFRELLKHKDYYRYSNIWMDEIKHPKDRITGLTNTNKLIRFYEGCDSGKTGYTSEAGHCLAASAFRNGLRLICVVINSPSSKERFKEVSSMFNYGFANYACKMVVDDKKPLDLCVNVSCGKSNTVKVIPAKPLFVFSKKTEKRAFELEVNLNENVKAPVSKGQELGSISVLENSIEIASIPLVALEDVLEQSYLDSIVKVIDNWAI